MKIVVLDGYTLNPGDLDWTPLKDLGICEFHDRTAPEDIVPRARDAELVLTNKTPLDAATLAKLPKLKYIGVLATGYNIVDVQAAHAKGVPVANIPTYGTASVAQSTFALLLELTNHAGDHSRSVRDGGWAKSKDFCYWLTPQIELAGLTLGLIGFGRIGKAVAAIATAFGLKIIVHDQQPLPKGVQGADLEKIFRDSDVVSLHCPLTPETKHLVNAKRLALMKKTAFLINTARGPLIDEKALAEYLNDGLIAGAGLDVLSIEPPRADNPLLKARNCIITPHISWATASARKRLLDMAVQNVKAFLAGKPQNVVN
jgi:glycerate dehydrogenase